MKRFKILLFTFFLLSCNSEKSNFHATTDGLKMHYESFGSGTNTIFFIHGWSGNSRVWTDQIEYFQKEFKVIVPDLPGFGKSGNERKNWTMQQYGDDIASLAVKLKTNTIFLVGWSMGGPVVLEAAKKLGNKVKAVIIVDVLRPLDSLSTINRYNYYALHFKNFDYFLTYHKGDSALAKRSMSIMPDSEKIPDHWKDTWMNLWQWINRDARECITEISVPIRAINSDSSETNVMEWKKYARDFDETTIKNSRHFLLWQYPQLFNERLEEIIKTLDD